jgi:D-aminopeptidase
MIHDGVKRALGNLKAVKPYVPKRPTTISIELSTTETADGFRGKHGVEVIAPLRVVSKGKNWMQAWNQIWHF